MTAPMTPERKLEIRTDLHGLDGRSRERDNIDLLAEVDRLAAALAATHDKQAAANMGFADTIAAMQATHDAACRAFAVRVLNEWEERRADAWSANDANAFFALRDAVESGEWPPKSDGT